MKTFLIPLFVLSLCLSVAQATKVCPNCGQEYPDDYNFCDQCVLNGAGVRLVDPVVKGSITLSSNDSLCVSSGASDSLGFVVGYPYIINTGTTFGHNLAITVDSNGHKVGIEVWSGAIKGGEKSWWSKHSKLYYSGYPAKTTKLSFNPTLDYYSEDNITILFVYWPNICGCKNNNININYKIFISNTATEKY